MQHCCKARASLAPQRHGVAGQAGSPRRPGGDARRRLSSNQDNCSRCCSRRAQVFVFWDLDNKRCRGQAERVLGNIRRVAGAFGRVALLRAYGNQTTMQERYLCPAGVGLDSRHWAG